MRDGDEDAGTEGRKCYLTMAPSGSRQTHKHTYVEEVATTSALKSGRPAPHERARFTAEPLRALGEPEDSDLGPAERRGSGVGGGFVPHASALFTASSRRKRVRRQTADLDSCLTQVAFKTVIENVFVPVCYHKSQLPGL